MARFTRNPNLIVILQHFTCMWILTVFGVFIGSFLPLAVLVPLSILCIVLIIFACFLKSYQLASFILYTIPFLIGIFLFWISVFFIELLGAVLVISIFIATVIIFVTLAVIGMTLKADISSWGVYLFTALIVVVIFSVIYLFVPVESTVLLIFAGICILLFALYTVYDFNLIRNDYIREKEIVAMALSLYLNFINIFVNLLEFVQRIRE